MSAPVATSPRCGTASGIGSRCARISIMRRKSAACAETVEMSAYYNENDPKTAAWLRELIRAGLIADGEVDERSITDVTADDLRGFVQCHFFAGIGGWSYALRLAGWDDARPVWTGSCPCQPWSVAGAGEGINDPRHLWPAWLRLIDECRPATIFGEQTASEDGKYWLDLVYVGLEARDYAIAAANLPAAGQGAPHARARLWFVAHTDREGFHGERALLQQWEPQPEGADAAWSGEALCDCGHRADVHDFGTENCDECSCIAFVGALVYADSLRAERVAGDEGRQKREAQGRWEDERGRRLQALNAGAARQLGHTNRSGLALGQVNQDGQRAVRIEGSALGQAGATRGFWADCDWLWHRDGCYRAVEPGSFPLVARLPGDVDQIRAFGNSIVPQVAQAFIEAYLDVEAARLSNQSGR